VDTEEEAIREMLSVRIFSNFIEAIQKFLIKNYHGHNIFSRRFFPREPFPLSWPEHTPRIFRKKYNKIITIKMALKKYFVSTQF
jgi:hypothetical protein